MKDIQSGIQSEFSPFDSGSGLDICFIGVSYVFHMEKNRTKRKQAKIESTVINT